MADGAQRLVLVIAIAQVQGLRSASNSHPNSILELLFLADSGRVAPFGQKRTVNAQLDVMTEIIALISALTAFAAVVLAPLVALHNEKKKITAQVLSANRQAWINALRDDLAHFITEIRHIAAAHAANAISTKEAITRYEAMTICEERVKLRLNPSETSHIELVRLMGAASTRLQEAINKKQSMAQELDAAADRIVKDSQGILKTEWNRVKSGE